MCNVDQFVVSVVVREGLMKGVALHLDIERWTRQWGKEGNLGRRKSKFKDTEANSYM